jgi:metal-responsive CopG/Arc/MetJ family transcriptional regulator
MIAIMAAKPVQISIDEELLERIDADPDVEKRGRSAFVRAALRYYLKVKRRRSVDDAITRAYGRHAGEARAESDELIETQAWPES